MDLTSASDPICECGDVFNSGGDAHDENDRAAEQGQQLAAREDSGTVDHKRQRDGAQDRPMDDPAGCPARIRRRSDFGLAHAEKAEELASLATNLRQSWLPW